MKYFIKLRCFENFEKSPWKSVVDVRHCTFLAFLRNFPYFSEVPCNSRWCLVNFFDISDHDLKRSCNIKFVLIWRFCVLHTDYSMWFFKISLFLIRRGPNRRERGHIYFGFKQKKICFSTFLHAFYINKGDFSISWKFCQAPVCTIKLIIVWLLPKKIIIFNFLCMSRA